MSSSRRWPKPGSSAPKPPNARRRIRSRSCTRARSRGAVLRRLRQPGTAGQVQRGRQRGRRLHDTRSAPAAPGAGRGARRAGRVSTSSSPSASARRRRPRSSRSTRALAKSSRWSADARYNQSQFNRAINARRQPGSVFKPFVYLAAFEHAFAEGRTDITPATIVIDEPTTFMFNDEPWEPRQLRGRI